jgi:protein ImuB
VPDGAPRRLRLDGGLQAVAAAEGPERIAPEWWRPAEAEAATRDYHRLDLADGRRLWVRRTGGWGDTAAPRWTLDGVFA